MLRNYWWLKYIPFSENVTIILQTVNEGNLISKILLKTKFLTIGSTDVRKHTSLIIKVINI